MLCIRDYIHEYVRAHMCVCGCGEGGGEWKGGGRGDSRAEAAKSTTSDYNLLRCVSLSPKLLDLMPRSKGTEYGGDGPIRGVSPPPAILLAEREGSYKETMKHNKNKFKKLK